MWTNKIREWKRIAESYQVRIGGKIYNGTHLFWWSVIGVGIWLFEPNVWVPLLSLLIAIILHEIAHGWVAYKLGDPTAKAENRLSLNPAVHLDLIGSFLLPMIIVLSGSGVLFGWAKPVPVNPKYFKHPSQGMMLVAIAGPLTNLAIAWLSGVLLMTVSSVPLGLQSYYLTFLTGNIVINTVLAVFNCIPVPPLDGSRIVAHFLPFKGRLVMHQLEPYGFLILFLLLYLGFFDSIIRTVVPILIQLLIPVGI